MKDTDKIAIFYIATGPYKVLFSDFLESLQNFYPNNPKLVKLISDGLEEYDQYEKGIVKVELCPRINHYPWPIIALYKMWHILENIDDSYEYSCYFNGNAVIHPHKEELFAFHKLNVSYHSFDNDQVSYDLWSKIHLNPYSSAYLENRTYSYIQSGFFFGKTSLIKQMCKDVLKMIEYDTSRCIFAVWHDESYLNKWCVEHHELVHSDHYMTVYPDLISNTRFIFLREKRDYSIQK